MVIDPLLLEGSWVMLEYCGGSTFRGLRSPTSVKGETPPIAGGTDGCMGWRMKSPTKPVKPKRHTQRGLKIKEY